MAKIALINQRYGLEVIGGSEYYTRQIAERLSDNHEVEVITTCALDYMTWENYYKNGIEVINNVTIRRFRTTQNRINELAKNDEQWIDYQGPFVPEMIEYIKENADKYDVFFPVTYLYYPTVRAIPYIAKKSIVIPTAHNEYLIYYSVYKRVFGADINYQKPAGFIFLTEQERKFTHKMFKNNNIPNEVAGIGVNLPLNIDGNRFREKYKIFEDYCLFIGRIDPTKGCEALIKYFIEYKKRNNNNIKLILIGKSIIEIPEHKDIIYLGFVSEEDKFDCISAAKTLWINSIFESLSIVVLEAFSLGIPVLVNKHCEVLKGHCKNSRAGLYYNGYFEFEGALNYLINNSSQYKEMQRNAKQYIEKNYKWDIIMNKFDNMINYIVNR